MKNKLTHDPKSSVLEARSKDKKLKKNDKSSPKAEAGTIVCPPSKNTVGNRARIAGYICRAIVIWFAVMGLTTFISDTLATGLETQDILSMTFFVTLIPTLICLNKYCAMLSFAGTAVYLAVFAATQNNAIKLMIDSVLTLFNAILERLYSMGYPAYIRFEVNVSSSEPREKLLAIALTLVSALIAACFVPCLIKKARLIPPAILSVLILVPVFVFNISEGNRGVALVIVSFASVIVMYAFDRLYAKGKKETKSDVFLFCENERPTLSSEAQAYLDEQEAIKKSSRRARKKEQRKKIRENTYTVDEELSDYFSKPSPKRKKNSGRDGSLRAIKKEIRAQRLFDKKAESTNSSSGGFAGIFMLLLCSAVIFLPSASVSGSFNTIPAIDDGMDVVRKYVTAVLQGDDPVLDEFDYKTESENFEPHSTSLEKLEFNKTQLFYVEANHAANIYMRGWVGVDYRDGGWYPASDEQLDAYRKLYDISEFPHETIYNSFIDYMIPSDAVTNDDYYISKYDNRSEYGFVSMLVNIRRVNYSSSLVGIPSYFLPEYGVMNYGSLEEQDKLSFINYFDGIYTGRKFKEEGIKYSFLSNVPNMKSSDRSENLAIAIADFNLSDEAIFLREAGFPNADGVTYSDVTLTVIDDGELYRFVYNYKYKYASTELRRIYLHRKDDVTTDGSSYRIEGLDGGVLNITVGERDKVTDAEYTRIKSNTLCDDYVYGMTTDEQKEYLSFSSSLANYSDFVYNTYTGSSGSEIIASLADEISHSGKETASEGEEALPIDVGTAAGRNSSDPETYIQRDLLVRSVIDYIIDDLNCKYTITPDVSLADASLDGVENFLTKTKQGYCVQFASAAALILREYGLPVRYVEGYIACDFTVNSNADAVSRYKAYVHDYEAHAWIEVWFDGIGWVQYETTPEYYDAMYGSGGSSSGSSGTVIDQIDQNAPEGSEESTTENDPLTPEDKDELDKLLAEQEAKERAIRNTVIFAVIALFAIAVTVAVSKTVSRARYEMNKRYDTLERITSEGFGDSIDESDRRRMALSLSDSVYSMLEIYGIKPKTGEFSGEFALRISLELVDIFGYPDGYKPENVSDYKRSETDVSAILDALSAEEFGHGMTPEQMKQVAIFDMTLRENVKTRAAFFKRLYLRYIKRLI